jgi:hypothetical protein
MCVAVWRCGDGRVAHNPKTQLFSAAIIGDTGPKDNLGEGSVLLNMKLLGRNVPPTNKAETFKLSIDNTQVLVAIIPASVYCKRSSHTRQKTSINESRIGRKKQDLLRLRNLSSLCNRFNHSCNKIGDTAPHKALGGSH